jgi:hypothetical protein
MRIKDIRISNSYKEILSITKKDSTSNNRNRYTSKRLNPNNSNNRKLSHRISNRRLNRYKLSSKITRSNKIKKSLSNHLYGTVMSYRPSYNSNSSSRSNKRKNRVSRHSKKRTSQHLDQMQEVYSKEPIHLHSFSNSLDSQHRIYWDLNRKKVRLNKLSRINRIVNRFKVNLITIHR